MTDKKIAKAEYQGRKVELDKPFRLPSGSSKKFGVYVKDGDKTKRVTFGSAEMEIKRDDPGARANFRARHNCSTAKDKTSARYWSCRMWESSSSVSDVLKSEAEVFKYQVSQDSFSMPLEAMVRAYDLGLDGDIHVQSGENGQAVYMPGRTHAEYLAHLADLAGIEAGDEEEEQEGYLERAVEAIINAVIGKSEDQMTNIQGTILKMDEEQRMVYGWASVATENGEPVVDVQGDIIKMAVLEKAATEFMLDHRVAKAMHDGDGIGEVVHSFPLSTELAKSLGVASPREGWLIGMKVHSDDVWKRVKSGELRAFSIGGKGVRQDVA